MVLSEEERKAKRKERMKKYLVRFKMTIGKK
jgi:hypothetical protein